MKNELGPTSIFTRKPDYVSFGYVTISLRCLVTSNLRHLDVVCAKTGLTPFGLDPVFVLNSKATTEISVQLTNFLKIVCLVE